MEKNLKSLVVGLGHVGLPLYCHLGNKYGFESVYALDKNKERVAELKDGFVATQEPGVALSVAQIDQVASSHAELDVKGFVQIHICVDIPLKAGVYDAANLFMAINSCIALYERCLILVRSTISTEIIAELRDVRLGEKQSLAFKPEFLREGMALRDLESDPNYLGLIAKGSAVPEEDFELYSMYGPESLVMLKIANNAWRANKVSFANLLAVLGESVGANPSEVADLFLADDLNTGDAYLRPGAPFGGYCLPKETEILSGYESGVVGSGLLAEVSNFNLAYINYWVDKILKTKPARVIFSSYSFKKGIVDTRNSPFKIMAERLIAQGVRVFLASEVSMYSENDLYVDVFGEAKQLDSHVPAKTLTFDFD